MAMELNNEYLPERAGALIWVDDEMDADFAHLT